MSTAISPPGLHLAGKTLLTPIADGHKAVDLIGLANAIIDWYNKKVSGKQYDLFYTRSNTRQLSRIFVKFGIEEGYKNRVYVSQVLDKLGYFKKYTHSGPLVYDIAYKFIQKI